MAEEKAHDTNAQSDTAAAATAGTDEASGELKVKAPKKVVRNHLWWAILSVYMLLFFSTGFLAFIEREPNPILKQGVADLPQQVNDETTRSFILNTLDEEADEHKKKDSLVLQSFNVVLGSLLGFLSASATMSVPVRDNDREGA
ncbi:MAG TPA: hypothetical protein VF544_13680 [Pyrinomonadaceae bacterium]